MGLLVFFLLAVVQHSDQKHLREERVSLAYSEFQVTVRTGALAGTEVESVEECCLLAPFPACILLALLYSPMFWAHWPTDGAVTVGWTFQHQQRQYPIDMSTGQSD